MVRRHLKRHKSPFYWPIKRKEYTWTIRPSPGPHPLEYCIPIMVIIRDMLGYAHTGKEARRIIKKGYIKVDRRVRRDPKYPAGLMDVIEIDVVNEAYRLMPYKKYPLTLVKIPEQERNLKIGKVMSKRRIKGDLVQITLHDGRNFIYKSIEESPKPYDSIVFNIEPQAYLQTLKMSVGNYAIVTGGEKTGFHGRIIDIKWLMPKRQSIALIETPDKTRIAVGIKNLFVIGEEKPLIKLPTGDEDVITGKW